MAKRIISNARRATRQTKPAVPKSGVIGHPVIHRGHAPVLPPPAPPQISKYVKVSWAWTDQSTGNISWTFVNSDPVNSHAVVLYRGATGVPNYLFGGAFWPIYLGPDDSVSHMLDGTQPVPTLTGTGGQPMGLIDYGAGASPRFTVAFIFNLAPGQTWTTPEGGFEGITPTPGVCYELVSNTSGTYCVGYDTARVAQWDSQTSSTNRGYSPNPSTYVTYAFQPEPTTPEVTLGYTDAIGIGACTSPGIGLRLEKSTFSQDEVAVNSSYPSAFFVTASGFSNAALGFTSASALTTQPSPKPQVTLSILQSLNTGLTYNQVNTISANLPTVAFGPLPIRAVDPTLGLNYQTFLYPFTISFPNNNAFNALNLHQVAVITLQAELTVGSGPPVLAQANIELSKGEDPYFTDLNPQNPAEYPSWLSFDLRFFKVTPNQSHQMFSVANPTSAGDAVNYIQTVLKHLNNPNLITNGDTFDATLTQDEDASALEFLPTDSSGNLTFNFAVARVRIVAKTKQTLDPVRVFFRLFQAASTVSDFHEVGNGEGTYRWGSNGSANHKIPLLGVQTDQQGNLEYVTIPCFATERINLKSPADMNTQIDIPNAQSITTVPGKEVDTFFGCWLDVNQTVPPAYNDFLIPTPPSTQSQWDGPWTGTQTINGAINVAPHQCLVAEIRYDDTPIPEGATTSSTDKLAQRNIIWIDGPNPGVDPSRVMPHPCEIRASASAATPDELMIDWGNTPPKSVGSLYLPAVQSSDVIALANSMYSAHLLTAADAHTIQCPAAGVTFIPVPAGKGRYAGLLSVDLPMGIVRGDRYNISVQQFETVSAQQYVPPPPPPPPKIATSATEAPSVSPAPIPVTFSWRQLTGAFQYSLAISVKNELLYPEERLLAWLKWRIEQTSTKYRWYPVLLRYLGLVEGRVSGFGGKPGNVPASPTGTVPGQLPPVPSPSQPGAECLEFTGKVIGIRYDRFGDFEGFAIMTFQGHEHWFKGREPQVQELVRRAWIDRTLISVFVDAHEPHWPVSIVLRRDH